jgi:hypothetical protein
MHIPCPVCNESVDHHSFACSYNKELNDTFCTCPVCNQIVGTLGFVFQYKRRILFNAGKEEGIFDGNFEDYIDVEGETFD